MSASAELDLDDRYVAHNYHPLPVVLTSGSGCWVTDVDGNRYLDMLAAYGAPNFGHGDGELRAVAHRQIDRLALTSRAFHTDTLGTFCAELAQLAGMEMRLTPPLIIDQTDLRFAVDQLAAVLSAA